MFSPPLSFHPTFGFSLRKPILRATLGISGNSRSNSQNCTHDLPTPYENLYQANGRGGFGSQTAADPPPSDPRRAPEKQTVGTVTASHEMLPLQALSSSLNVGTAKRGYLGRGEAFGLSPKQPHPFALIEKTCFLEQLSERLWNWWEATRRSTYRLLRNCSACIGDEKKP